MDVAAFFITARLAAQADSTAFSEALAEQLASLLGEQLPASAAIGNRDAHRRLLLRTATQRAHSAGRRLVLVIDGLDEDRSRQMAEGLPSIASLLPRRPEHGLRVIVSGRPNPEIPGDVPGDHPLRHCSVQHLAVSPHASDIERLAKDELRRVLRGSPAERDLLGLVTASLGGLTRADLMSLTALPPHEIDDILTGVAGRTISSRVADDPSGTDEHRVHFLAHDTLQAEAERSLGTALLGQYRQKLHDWASRYRDSNWPEETPVYLLGGYLRMLQAAEDRRRVVELARDKDRQGRILNAFANDIMEALRSLPAEYRTAVYLHEIENFSLQEIAEIMGMNLESARHRVHKGREQLRLALAQQNPEGRAGGAASGE
jgi:RNA polymerase sigma factor (sigma-70 family)